MSPLTLENNYETDLPYVLISGSFRQNQKAELIATHLGLLLSKLPIGIVSAAGKPAKCVCQSFYTSLIAQNNYHSDLILTFYRIKSCKTKRYVDTYGTVRFFGSSSTDIREKIISLASAMIIICGKRGTKEEELIAKKYKIPIIPIGSSGGAAKDIWKEYKINVHKFFSSKNAFDVTSFDALTSDDHKIAAEGTLNLLKTLLKI